MHGHRLSSEISNEDAARTMSGRAKPFRLKKDTKKKPDFGFF